MAPLSSTASRERPCWSSRSVPPAAVDVASQSVHVYFFDATNADFVDVDPPTIGNVVSFHTQWDAQRITRAFWENASGATQDFAVPANMVGAHHASTNHSGPTATWSDSRGRTDAVSIGDVHTCTYLRTR